MKIFAILGLTLVACSLANGLALKGSNGPARLSVQQQEQLTPVALDDLSQQQEEQPTPYQFSYDTQSEGSQSSRSESGDAAGKVIGQYSIKGADGISRIVSYTADSEGFRANITTNEPGTETSNPSFIVLQSSQLPASEISKQLQTEADLAQQEEQPAEEQSELPAPSKSLPAPRKATPAKTTATRRPAPLPQQAPRQSAQVNVVTKSRRPTQQAQTISAPAKRPAASPAKGQALRTRGPTKNLPLPTSTTPRPRPVQAAPMKRPALPTTQEQTEEEAPAQLSADQTEEAVADEDAQF